MNAAHRRNTQIIGIFLGLVAVGCASGDVYEPVPDASEGGLVDAKVWPDATRWPDASVADARGPDAAIPPVDAALPDAFVPPPVDAALPDAALPDATPPDAALPDAYVCTDVIQQKLGNENFDIIPNTHWTEVSTFTLITAAVDLPVTPQSGNYALWLGGALSSIDGIYQDITIPAGAKNVQVAGYRWFATEETSGQWDFVDVQIRNTSNTVLETLATWSNADSTTAWTPFTLNVAGNYGGQTIRLYLVSDTDSTLNTNFFFYTMAFRVTVCL